MSTGIKHLPNEVLQHILCYSTPLAVTRFQLVCRRFNSIVDNVIWRHFCRTEFKYWNTEHCIRGRLSNHVENTDWRSLYIRRHLGDRLTTTMLDSIISNQMGRIEKFQVIIDQGYDAKDCLLRHYNVSEDAEDHLARRYYSGAVLGCTHRMIAIEEWSRLQQGKATPLERALAAFDMFVLHERQGDCDDVASRLDEIACCIRAESGDFDAKSTRQKSLLIVQYLRAQGLVGYDISTNYQDLQHNFIGIALFSPNHPALPLVSTAIFCCVAQRLGVDAAACSFPFHVIATVSPPEGYDSDGQRVQSFVQPMYLDPFASAFEVDVRDLVSRLESIRAVKSNYGQYLSASTPEEIVLRTGRNIIKSVQEAHHASLDLQTMRPNSARSGTQSFPDLESSFYGALWASLLLSMAPDGHSPANSMPPRDVLPHIIDQFETNFPTDVCLVEKYILPLFQNTVDYAQLRESVRVTRSVDSMPKAIKRRTDEVSERVRYKIGQVFHHKRYGYQAVVTGWDVECGADEQWMRQMRVHELSRGKQQSFYHVLVEDKTVRYVAEENIELVSPELPNNLMSLAGKHFKRWDKTASCFISNIEDEYPDG